MSDHRPEWVRDLYRRLGHEIRKARLNNHLSQKGLADLLGLTRPVIANMEHGRQGINVDRLVDVARVLDLKVGDLLSRCKDNP